MRNIKTRNVTLLKTDELISSLSSINILLLSSCAALPRRRAACCRNHSCSGEKQGEKRVCNSSPLNTDTAASAGYACAISQNHMWSKRVSLPTTLKCSFSPQGGAADEEYGGCIIHPVLFLTFNTKGWCGLTTDWSYEGKMLILDAL